MRARLATVLGLTTLLAGTLATAPRAHADDRGDACYADLTARGIAYRRATRKGIALGVEVTGPVGGLTLTYSEALVLDCSMVVSLAEAGPYLTALGFDRARIMSGYARRNVRGTSNPSKHSYGLAVDIAGFSGPDVGTVRVDRDFEQGLGDGADCIGAPTTEGGALLKVAQCQLTTSGLFHLVLSPDYDDAHHDHFHLEALPWSARTQLRATKPAIH